MTWLSLLILLGAFALIWPLGILFGWIIDKVRRDDLDERVIADLRSRVVAGTSATWVGPRQQPEADDNSLAKRRKASR